jgi:hypothetical protein
VDEGKIIDSSTIKEALLFEVKAHTKEPCLWVQVRTGNTCYLVNKASTTLALGNNDEVCGFGQGSFKLGNKDALPDGADNGKGLKHELTDESTIVVYNNVVTTLGKVAQAHWSTKPNAPIVYHNINRSADDPMKFTLTQTHNIFYIPSANAAESNNQFSIGARLTFDHWMMSTTGQVIWHVRWQDVKV